MFLPFQLPLDNVEDGSCMTFVMKDEDHTLGNALRYMLMKKLVARGESVVCVCVCVCV